MDNLIYILFVSVFIPILLMAGLIEKKARHPIIFVLIGIFVFTVIYVTAVITLMILIGIYTFFKCVSAITVITNVIVVVI